MTHATVMGSELGTRDPSCLGKSVSFRNMMAVGGLDIRAPITRHYNHTPPETYHVRKQRWRSFHNSNSEGSGHVPQRILSERASWIESMRARIFEQLIRN